jgi:peptide/nickel transport system ATP-binding protein
MRGKRKLSNNILSATDLKLYYNIRRGFTSLVVKAVDGVDLELKEREVLGIVGESGCGKSTLSRALAGLETPTGGEIFFEGKPLSDLKRSKSKLFHKNVQMIFQDPFDSINPRYNVYETIAEGLRVQGSNRGEELTDRIRYALTQVRLTPPEAFEQRYPFELSGGQLQRVAVARALVLEPKVLLADEPVSMLDVSVRAEVLNTLTESRESKGMAVVFVSHDIALAEYASDRLAVMYLGKVVETGQAEQVVNKPLHPYTMALIDAVPEIGKTLSDKERILGEVASSINVPNGCRFHPRCPYAQQICKSEEPKLREVESGHYAACHFAGEISQ